MRKSILRVLCFIVALLLPAIAVLSINAAIPKQYGRTFLAELAPKYERLSSVGSPKTVLIGGSNLAFGIDSAKMEEYTGRPCVNFGLYATLGTKAMLELSLGGLGRGDIVVLCPETDPQTYSLFFDARSMCQALEAKPSMFFGLENGEKAKVAAALPEHLTSKLNFYRTATTPDPEGVYRKDSFNALGDVVFPREFNDMVPMFDETTVILPDASIVSEEFIGYVNDYAEKASKKGARVFFSFPPMNELAMADGTDEKALYAFYSYLASVLDFEIISNINDYILDAEYFYDTNYHLNDTGVEYRTSLLARDINRVLGNTEPLLSLSFPSHPVRPDSYFGFNKDDDKTGFFEYEVNGDVCTLVGLTEEGAKEELLVMPVSYNGVPVTSIAKDAFAKSECLERVFVSDNTNLVSFADGAFDNCPTLKRVELTTLPEQITASQRLFGDSAKDVRIFVPLELYSKYVTNYEWGALTEKISVI